MKQIMLLLFVLIALAGCKNEENITNTEVDQAWLNDRIAEIEKSDLKQYFYIMKAEYKGQCIMYVSNCCPMCLSIVIPYTCDGTKMGDIDLTKIENQEIIWKPDNFACSL